MDFIDGLFASISEWTKEVLPKGAFTSLLAEGIIPGLGGIVIFIPQIAFLFLFIAILEESGYMSRVVFLMDRVMRRFGLSGKSVVPLISGTACAIPAIMATRNIESWKERLNYHFSNTIYNLFGKITCLLNYYCLSHSRRANFWD